MRFSPTQSDAVLALFCDPLTKVRKPTRLALERRGLVDDSGRLTRLGREAARRLIEMSASKEDGETRIHLQGEPATQAQLRCLRRLLKFAPSDVSKDDASLLIDFVEPLVASKASLDADRLRRMGLLLRHRAQARDAIGFSANAPQRIGKLLLEPGFETRLDGERLVVLPFVEISLQVGGGVLRRVSAKPIPLRSRAEPAIARSRAQAVFAQLTRQALAWARRRIGPDAVEDPAKEGRAGESQAA